METAEKTFKDISGWQDSSLKRWKPACSKCYWI